MKRVFWLLVVAYMVMFLALVPILLQVRVNRSLTRQGNQAHQALCILKSDLQQHVDDARAFLIAHPVGFDGINAEVIQSSITNQQATIDALKSLTCPQPKGTP